MSSLTIVNLLFGFSHPALREVFRTSRVYEPVSPFYFLPVSLRSVQRILAIVRKVTKILDLCLHEVVSRTVELPSLGSMLCNLLCPKAAVSTSDERCRQH